MRTVTREVKKVQAQIKLGVVDANRVEVFERFVEFVSEGKYFSYAQKDVLLANLFEEDEVLAYNLGVSTMAVRKLRSTLSRAVYAKLGYDVVDKILFGSESDLKDVSDALILADFNVRSSDVVPRDLLDFIKHHTSDSETSFELFELSTEIAFLKKYSLKAMKTEALSCDMDKLRFVVDKLDSSDFGSSLDKDLVRKLLF